MWPLVRETLPEEPMASVKEPAEIFPLVRVRVLFTVGLLLSVTPFVLLMVRLFNAVTLLGMLTPLELPPKTRLEDEVVDKLAGVPAIVGPFSVKVFPATDNAPLVSVSVPLTVAAPPRVALPLDWLIVRLLYVKAAMACAEPL